MSMKLYTVTFFLFFLFSARNLFAQEEETSAAGKGAKGFHAGVYLGSYYANKYTSRLYDGWGYDQYGKRNDFSNSFMNRRINYDYGGAYGQTDYVAQALGVNHGEWSFDETDMPLKVKYTSSFLLGLQMDYAFTKKDALVVNMNASKLLLAGDFTIVITNPAIGPQQPNYQNIKTFAITGGEQRFMLQAGYRRLLGNSDVINFFVEGGPEFNATRYLKNQATINNLGIDLSLYYTQAYYPTYHASYLRGSGLGVFTGFGLVFNVNAKGTLQALYNPSFAKINIGESPAMKLQNAFGLRGYYKF